MRSCKVDPNDLNVVVAPEPSDIFWENLEIPERSRLIYRVTNDIILGFLVFLSALLLIATNTAADVSKKSLENDENSGQSGQLDSAVRTGQSLGLSCAASGITVITNALISVVVMRLSKNAGPISQTGFQRSIFSMLSLFYVINTSITPFFVGVLESFRTGHMTREKVAFSSSSTGQSNMVYQYWYDAGGVVNNMIFTMVTTMLSFAFVQMVPIFSFLKRHVLARRATSQQKLNALWLPPRMDVGKNYAKLFKATSLVIIYAPLYPPFYLIAVFYLLVSYYASRIGISYWFARPSMMREMVSEHMRGWLAGAVGISIVMKRFIMNHNLADVPLYLSFVAWATYMLVFEVFQKTIQDEVDLDEDNPGSESMFSDLKKEVYVCPKLHRGQVSTTRDRHVSLEALPTRLTTPRASTLGPGGVPEQDQSGGVTSGPIAGTRPLLHPCRSPSSSNV